MLFTNGHEMSFQNNTGNSSGPTLKALPIEFLGRIQFIIEEIGLYQRSNVEQRAFKPAPKCLDLY